MFNAQRPFFFFFRMVKHSIGLVSTVHRNSPEDLCNNLRADLLEDSLAD